MDRVTNQVATYFTTLKLENVRCFGPQVTLSLLSREGRPAPWTLILGDNGVGKTTLLECLFWTQPTLHDLTKKQGNKWDLTLDAPPKEELLLSEPISTGATSHQDKQSSDTPPDQNRGKPKILGPILLDESDEVIEGLLRVGPSTRAVVRATLVQDASLLRQGDTKEIPVGVMLQGNNGELTSARYIEENVLVDNVDDFDNINLIAYPATRWMGTLNLSNNEDDGGPTNPFAEATLELYDAAEILMRLDYASSKANHEGKSHERLLQFTRFLVDILPGIDTIENIIIKGPQVPGRPKSETGVHLNTRDGLVPLSALSLGYRTTLALAVDLAWRMVDLYPNSPAPLAEPAIVLIDEIDLHLHPLWQQTIKDRLARHFPNTQFICTSHSPLMAQAAATDNLVVIRENDNGQLVIENDPIFIRGWRVDQILTSQYFGLDNTRGIETQGRIEERAALLLKSDRSDEEERRLIDLEDEIANLHTEENPEDERAMNLIRQAAALLKSRAEGLP